MGLGKTLRIKDSSCPNCNKLLDATSAMDGDDKVPKDGDISICAYCGGVAIFRDGSLRSPTKEDWDVIQGDPEVWDSVKVAQLAVQRLRRNGKS